MLVSKLRSPSWLLSRNFSSLRERHDACLCIGIRQPGDQAAGERYRVDPSRPPNRARGPESTLGFSRDRFHFRR